MKRRNCKVFVLAFLAVMMCIILVGCGLQVITDPQLPDGKYSGKVISATYKKGFSGRSALILLDLKDKDKRTITLKLNEGWDRNAENIFLLARKGMVLDFTIKFGDIVSWRWKSEDP